MQAASIRNGRSASWARRLSVDAAGWLRSDIVDVVVVLPGHRTQSDPRAPEDSARPGSHLDEALARWSRRFARQRLFVLAPRGLALALGLGALIALVIAASGSRLSLAVVLWLVVPPLVCLAVVLSGSWRDPRPPEVARVLDRDLALDERLGTAVELSGGELAADGLGALVLAEANAALIGSDLGGARPTHRSAQREWLAIAGAVLIISGLLVVISDRGDASGLKRLAAVTSAGHPVGRNSAASPGGANHARSATGRGRNPRPEAGRTTTQLLKSASRNPALSVVTQPQSSTAGGRLAAGGHGNQRTPSGASGSSGSQTAGLGAKAGRKGASGGAGNRAGNSSSAAANQHSALSSRGGRAGSSRGAAGRGHTTNPQRVGVGSRAGTFNSDRAASSRGSTKAPSSGNSSTHGTAHTKNPSARSAAHAGRSPSGHGSAGNSAGTGSGGNPVGGRPQTKGLPRGSAGSKLPIQIRYTAASKRSGSKTGNPAGRSGGKGPARSATENGGGSATAVKLPYIPPSADTGPTADSAVLQHYFSAVLTVSGHW